jgi:hypothetical protein
MRIRGSGLLILAAAGVAALAGLAGRSYAIVHNGGVDCTNWNGTYVLAGASAKESRLVPPRGDTITIRQNSCAGVDLGVTIGGQRYVLAAHTNDSQNDRVLTIRGRPTRVHATWVDGYGKNWMVSLTPDPMTPTVPYSVREYLLTSLQTVTVADTIRDPHNQVPLATFPATAGGKKEAGGRKIQEVVGARAVYLLPVKR